MLISTKAMVIFRPHPTPELKTVLPCVGGHSRISVHLYAKKILFDINTSL